MLRARLSTRACLEAAPRVAELMAAELGEDQAWRDEQLARFQKLAEDYLPAALEAQGAERLG